MSLGNLSQNYFSQLLDPKYRQAQQQQNLFSNLLQYGAQMRAAGAPTTNVGQPALLASKALGTLGQNLMKGNQAYQNQLMNAIKLKSMMDTSKRAQSMHDIDLKTKRADLKAKERWENQFKIPIQEAAVPQMTPDPLGDIADTYSGVGVSGGTQAPPPKIGQVPGQFKALGVTPEQWRAIGLLPPDLGQKALIKIMGSDKAPVNRIISVSDQTTPDGKPLYNWGRYQGSKLLSTYVAPKGDSGISIDLGGSTTFGKKTASDAATEYGDFLRDARLASIQLPTIKFLQGVINQPGFDTGAAQKWFLPFQQLGKSLGVDVDESMLATKEAFAAKTSELVLASVAKMRGALSDKELIFLQSQQADLGNTPAGNKLLLWLSRQQLEKAKAFRDFATTWTNEKDLTVGEAGSTVKDYRQMLKDWHSQEIYKQNPYDYVAGLAAAEEARLTNEGRLSEMQIAQRLESQFSLSLLRRIYPR